LYFAAAHSAPFYVLYMWREKTEATFPLSIFFVCDFFSFEKAEKIAKHIKELFTGELFPKVVIFF
jgi:hypothetical protein